jgi:AbrB family looped-hinge helix DNA binding protein
MKAKVAERGQVTIPKKLRKRLGIRPGTVLEFHEEEGRLVARKATTTDVVNQIYGSLGKGRRTDDLIDELRGES